MTAHRAGSRACRWLKFFFVFVQKNWASYEALSQQRGIEPATWHWASNEGMVNLYCTGPMDFPMQPLQFKQITLLINSGTMWDKIEDWQSIRMYYIKPQPYNWLWPIWGNTSFLEGDAYPWAGGRLGKVTFDIHPSIHPSHLSISFISLISFISFISFISSIYPSIHLSIYLSIHPSIHV